MKHVEGILADAEATSSCDKCSPETCCMKIESEDELGDSADSFNRLIFTLSSVLDLQTDLQRFSELLTAHLELETLCNETLYYLIESTKANGGAILTEHGGELEVISTYGIDWNEHTIVSSMLQQAIQKQKRQMIRFPEKLVLDGVLTQFRPKEILIEPIVFKEVIIGVIVLAST